MAEETFANKDKIAELKRQREKTITKTSVIGIIVNVLLVVFKAIAGLLANSIAIILDAVNNLTDALSSLVTMIGNLIAGRKPDKKHPLGHGRVEYLSAMIVAALVLYAGITAGVESVKKIITPKVADYSTITFVIISVAVAVKIVLGIYFKAMGKKTHSYALTASGTDALFDAIISFSVLVSAVLYLLFGINLEAYVGILISLFIIKSGLSMLFETLDDIVGHRADRELVSAIKKTVCENENVLGAYDLIIHSYGPEKHIASIHVEVADTMTADKIDQMERNISAEVYRKHGVIMAGIGIYSLNTKDEEAKSLREKVFSILEKRKYVLQIHGFHYDKERKLLNVDVILDFDTPDMQAEYCSITEELKRAFPDLTVNVIMDLDA